MSNKFHIPLVSITLTTSKLQAHYCVVHTNSPQPLPLPLAFKRFFQVIAAGMLLPDSPALIDPCDQPRRINQSLSMEDMDQICSTAQTLLRVIIHGGAELVLGLNSKRKIEGKWWEYRTDCVRISAGSNVASEITILNGVLVTPLERAYDPDEMPEALAAAAAMRAQQAQAKAVSTITLD